MARKKNKFSLTENQLSILKFLVKFNIFAIPLYIILILNATSPEFQIFTADIAFYLLKATGLDIVRDGTFFTIPIEGGSWGAFINWDCTGWKSIFALFALIMATPFSTMKKIKGLVILLPVIYLVNLGRIVVMFHIAATNLEYFEIAHAIIWSWGMILVVLGFWLIWMNAISRNKYIVKTRK